LVPFAILDIMSTGNYPEDYPH